MTTARDQAPKTKCDTVLRVRVFALSPDGRCALDALAQSEDACDLDTRALSVLASALVEGSTEGVDPHPRRVRVEVSLSKGGKGTPKSLNRDCPWDKRAANAADLAKSCAVRLSATPEKAPPGTALLDAGLDGALDALDLVDQAKDGLDLIKSLAADGGPDDQSLERIGALLEDPRVGALLDRLEKQSKKVPI